MKKQSKEMKKQLKVMRKNKMAEIITELKEKIAKRRTEASRLDLFIFGLFFGNILFNILGANTTIEKYGMGYFVSGLIIDVFFFVIFGYVSGADIRLKNNITKILNKTR